MKAFMTRKLEVKEQIELVALFGMIGLLIFVLAIRSGNELWSTIGAFASMSGLMGMIAIIRDKLFERN